MQPLAVLGALVLPAMLRGAFGFAYNASLRIAVPTQTALMPSAALARASLSGSLPTFGFGPGVQTRNSAKRGGGTTKNNRNSAGRRLGIKRAGSTSVIPGNIIVRQRGTHWHPGEHVKMGKDHTLYATVPGFVRFYKPWPRGAPKPATPALGDLPLRLARPQTVQAKSPSSVRPHPSANTRERRYVGVVLRADEQLPRPPSLPRSRLFDKVDLHALEREKELLRQGIEPLATDPSLY